MSAVEKLIASALSQIGYEEPNHDNGQKYGEFIDTTTWYLYKEGSKTWVHKVNFYDWCTQFVDWNFISCFGIDTARKILNRPDYNNYGAVVKYQYKYFEQVGRTGKTPKRGAVIFFQNSDGLCHVGIVSDFDNETVTTVEGNAGRGNYFVVQNRYKLTDKYIYGFGYPDYEAATKYPEPPFMAHNILKGVAIKSNPYGGTDNIIGYIQLNKYVQIEALAGVSGDFGKITGYVYLPKGFTIDGKPID